MCARRGIFILIRKNKNVKTISYYIMNKKIKYTYAYIYSYNNLFLKYSKIVFFIQKKKYANDPERSGT
jgi:hypothetical protein